VLAPASNSRVLPRCCAQESKRQWGKAPQEAGGGGGGHQVDLDEEDDLEEFRLPMSHRPTENLDTEGLEQASVHTQLTASNVGFRLLQKMGWKTGKGLGKNEQGIFRLLLYMLPFYCHDCLLVPIAIENPRLGACIILFTAVDPLLFWTKSNGILMFMQIIYLPCLILSVSLLICRT